MKIAVILLSDPKNGDEALGRVFNGLALAAEAQARGDQVEIVFLGAGARWPAELAKLGHPAHGLYDSVRPAVLGVSCACAAVFGSTAEVQACGVPELKDHALAGTPGMAGLRRYAAEGWATFTF
jgi:hypothetical protein